MNKEMNEPKEPKDICCICNKVGESGSMQEVNPVDFELLCDACKGKRCRVCDFLRSKMKFKEERYFCRHRGCIENPDEKICDNFKDQEE